MNKMNLSDDIYHKILNIFQPTPTKMRKAINYQNIFHFILHYVKSNLFSSIVHLSQKLYRL